MKTTARACPGGSVVIAIASMLIAAAGCGEDGPKRDPSAPTRTIYYQVGPDHRFDTADDVPAGYDDFEYANGGVDPTLTVRHGAGPNGIWFDEDDVVTDFYEMTYDRRSRTPSEPTRFTHVEAPGGDGVWFTEDDGITLLDTRELDANGNVVRYVRREDGDDRLLGTADDLWVLTTMEYDPAGLLTNEIAWWVGPDHTPLTADDAVGGYTATARDGRGRKSRAVSYVGPGADGTWFTADDAASQYLDFRYDQAGNLDRMCTWSTGPDQAVGPGDDGIEKCEQWIFDTDGREISYYVYEDGEDGVPETDDDVGERFRTKKYVGGNEDVETEWDLGPDHKPRTEDDSPYYEQSSEYDAQNRPVKIRVRFRSADLVMGTDDDMLGYRVFVY